MDQAMHGVREQLEHMMRTHYSSVLPKEAKSTAAVVASLWSDIDVMEAEQYRDDGQDFNDAFNAYVSLNSVPRLLRLEQARVEHTVEADDVNFAQPLQGNGVRDLYEMRSKARETVAAFERWQWLRLQEQKRLVDCPRSLGVHGHMRKIHEGSSLKRGMLFCFGALFRALF